MLLRSGIYKGILIHLKYGLGTEAKGKATCICRVQIKHFKLWMPAPPLPTPKLHLSAPDSWPARGLTEKKGISTDVLAVSLT